MTVPLSGDDIARDIPPNILVLVADDLGVDGVGAYGEGLSLPKTPNIDSLAAGGLLFRNAWANPVCSTTRAAILTGNYAFRNGIGWLVLEQGAGPALQPSSTTLPEALALATGGRYANAAFGKWHLGNSKVGGASAPNVAGFSHFSGSLVNLLSPSNYFSWMKTVNGVTSATTVYATTATVDDALGWIATAPEPWYCHIGFHAPHTPLHAPPAALHSVDLSQPTERKLFEAMVEALDTEIGRLLAGIPEPALANTTIVFVGDNGSHSKITIPPFDPKHAKGTLYEGGLNVPLIIGGARVAQPGSETQALVQTTDLFRTALDLSGGSISALPKGSGVDSRSLLPYLADPSVPTVRTYVYAEGFRPNGTKKRPPYFTVGGAGLQATCQEDFGFSGPGNAVLSICGEPLYGGYLDSDQDAQLLLSGAAPNSVGTMFVGYQANPTSMFGGLIVPNPPFSMDVFVTDQTGHYKHSVSADPDLLGPRYYQVVVDDPFLPGQSAVSNCVSAVTLPADQEAVRDERFKLILDNNMGREEFFDLAADPFEQTNLLQFTLTPMQAGRYMLLRQELMQLRWQMD